MSEEKQYINDMDHFAILERAKKGDIEGLKSLQEIMIGRGIKEGLVYSDLAHFKEHKRKEPIKFPFLDSEGKIREDLICEDKKETDLKTLKDLITTNEPHGEDDFVEARRIKKVLRQEAIKEIKLAESSIAKESTRGVFGWGTDFLFTKDVIGYIKWKNNIKEEDLK